MIRQFLPTRWSLFPLFLEYLSHKLSISFEPLTFTIGEVIHSREGHTAISQSAALTGQRIYRGRLTTHFSLPARLRTPMVIWARSTERLRQANAPGER